ncbi:MAG: hypothetical protein C3F06_02830 [Candidatus Methanoperedenaceae archaeon]|nr:MAG: hypothetical protein C3F06_02830 [Candidatus Methanoperedenaceae archaeon]
MSVQKSFYTRISPISTGVSEHMETPEVEKMEKNAGTVDRIVRVVIGIILLYAVATGMVQGIPMYIAGILGLMMLVTAALAYCPLYPAMKINTATKQK